MKDKTVRILQISLAFVKQLANLAVQVFLRRAP